LLLLWDWAPWHLGAPIQEIVAVNPRLEILYFSAAVPDVNLQEHVWKATWGSVKHNHRDRQLSVLAKHFKSHLTTVCPTSFLKHQGCYTIHPRSN
jgi:hypothetical protein